MKGALLSVAVVFAVACTSDNTAAGLDAGQDDLVSAGGEDLAGSDGAATVSCTAPMCASGAICLPPATCVGTQVCAAGALTDSCGNGACDCGESSSTCPADCACASGCQTAPGTCIADGACGATAGTVCMGTQIVSSCGNGTCDCGEDPTICPTDCGCASGSCVVATSCVASGSCTSASSGQICSSGTVTSSCGDHVCNCGETQATCPTDCGGCPASTDCALNNTCYAQGTCEPGTTGQVCKNGSWVASCGDGTCSCGDTTTNCAADCSGCTGGGCSSNGTCIPAGTCEPGTPGQICNAGSFASSCGNGKCDCGETSASCAVDCGCPANTCAMGGKCYPLNACSGSTVCNGTSFVASCGDKICDCGETSASCPTDCPTKCKNGSCFFEQVCAPAGSCEPPGTISQSCTNGVYGSSCGDGRCDCGETPTSCPADCH